MNLKFKLSETGLDGIVQSIQAASPNPVIDIHIEGNAVEDDIPQKTEREHIFGYDHQAFFSFLVE